MDEDDEFNDFEEAQPPAPSNPTEPLEVVPDLGWNISIEGTSLPLQSEGVDIGSTLQTGSGSFGFAFDLESPLQVDSLEPQMGKIGSVYDLTNTTIIPPFSKQNSLQLPISSTDLFDFNTAIQTQSENQLFQASETPSFLPVTELEKPTIQQTQFMFQFQPIQASNPSNITTSNSSNGQYSLDLFDWGKTQISQSQQQQKQIQFKEIVKIDQNDEFNFSESIAPSLIVNDAFEFQGKKEKEEILPNQQKQEEEQFQFNQAKKSDNDTQEVKILPQEPNILGQTKEIFSQFQSHKINQSNFSLENFDYSQPIIITKLQDSQIRKQSDQFQFATEQPRVEQVRKQSEDFEFQEQTTQIPLFQPLQYFQQPNITIQSQFQVINPSPLNNFYEEQKSQTLNQATNVEVAHADPQEQDEFGDFQEPPSDQQQPISNAEVPIPTSAPVQPVEIKQQYSDSYERDFYKERKEYLDNFVANLPDYSFLLSRGFLN